MANKKLNVRNGWVQVHPNYWRHYVNDEIHHDSEPAEIDDQGTERWVKHGLIHREGKPAIIWKNGSNAWYFQGQRHRLDGPAITNSKDEIKKGGSIYSFYIYGKFYNLRDYLNAINISESEKVALLLKYSGK